MNTFAMKVFGIAGFSGSGKTTLIEQLIPRLTARGLKVSVIKHAHHGFVGSAVGRPPQRSEPSDNTGKKIRAGRARSPNGCGRCALAVIGVQHQDLVHRLLYHRIQLILFRRDGKQHMQEITRIREIVPWILPGCSIENL